MNVPQPGVPESFKVLVKELQSLCLDVRVLDEEGQEIELRNDDDDDDYRSFRDVENYRSDDDELMDAGYSSEDVPEDAGTEVDFDSFDDDDDADFGFADDVIDTDEEGE